MQQTVAVPIAAGVVPTAVQAPATTLHGHMAPVGVLQAQSVIWQQSGQVLQQAVQVAEASGKHIGHLKEIGVYCAKAGDEVGAAHFASRTVVEQSVVEEAVLSCETRIAQVSAEATEATINLNNHNTRLMEAQGNEALVAIRLAEVREQIKAMQEDSIKVEWAAAALAKRLRAARKASSCTESVQKCKTA